VRFLLDQNQSPRLIELLAAHGHEAQHVRDLGMRASPDIAILEAARRSGQVIISGDTDFGELLASSDATGPLIVLIRRQGQRRAHQIVALLLANLDVLTDELEAGAIVVLDADRIRVRRLPIDPD
jgi:predicted nuclease of predicted toxin-antitoxin system